MLVPGSANPLLLRTVAAAAAGGISRSLRFNSSDSAYLSRTPASAGNRKTWTWAGWVKKCSNDTASQYLFATSNSASASAAYIYFNDNNLRYWDRRSSADGLVLVTNAVFRDNSAWFHIVLSVDYGNATSSNRARFFVNGVEQTYSTSSYPSATEDSYVNAATAHYIAAPTQYFNGLLADCYLIDGAALTPSSFTETDATTGQLIPKAYTGSYGTNGFHLEFADNSAATATTLGKDTSGNGNNWTPVNLSVTAGAGNDSLVDVPTNGAQTDTGVGGEVRGNYATLNPLDVRQTTGAFHTLSNGNLTFTGTAPGGGATGSVPSTIGVATGKWYAEFTLTASSSGNTSLGIISASSLYYVGYSANSYGYYQSGQKINNDTLTSYGNSYTTNDVIGIALDLDSGTITFYKNGSSQGQAFSGLSGTYFFAVGKASSAATNEIQCNFGQRAFAYTAPSGYKALCTANLTSTTITTSGSYTGNGVADGPFVFLNGVPTAMTIGGNAVTFGTHADKLSNGFKIRTTSTTYNQNASTYSYSITTTGDAFKYARAQSN